MTTAFDAIKTAANNLIAYVSPRHSQKQPETPRSLTDAIDTSGLAAAIANDESKSPKGSSGKRESFYSPYDPAAERGSKRNLTIEVVDTSEEYTAAPYTMTPASTKAQRAFEMMLAMGKAMMQVFSGVYNLVSPTPPREADSASSAPSAPRPAPLDTQRDSIVAMANSQNGPQTTGEYTAYVSPHVRGTPNSPYGYYDPNK